MGPQCGWGVDTSAWSIQLCRPRGVAIQYRKRRISRQGSSVVEQPRKHSGLVGSERRWREEKDFRSQGSSVVEQGTHKPLVGSSTLPPGRFYAGDFSFETMEQPRKHSGLVGSSTLPWQNFPMAWVYILRGASGRHYIGSTVDLEARFAQHLRGHTASTKRLGGELKIVASKQFSRLEEARKMERALKRKKNPALAIFHLKE